MEQKTIIKTKIKPISKRLITQNQRKEITQDEVDKLMKTKGNDN